jgi:hypothetical protein
MIVVIIYAKKQFLSSTNSGIRKVIVKDRSMKSFKLYNDIKDPGIWEEATSLDRIGFIVGNLAILLYAIYVGLQLTA